MCHDTKNPCDYPDPVPGGHVRGCGQVLLAETTAHPHPDIYPDLDRDAVEYVDLHAHPDANLDACSDIYGHLDPDPDIRANRNQYPAPDLDTYANQYFSAAQRAPRERRMFPAYQPGSKDAAILLMPGEPEAMMAEPPHKVTYVDVSDYQWPGILTQLQPMYDAGVRVLIIKVTQGTGHLQKHFREVYAEAKRIGYVVTFYHFCTNDNGITQADWCKKNVGDLAIDLPLMMDVEAFTSTYFSLNIQVGADVHPVIPFRYGLTDYQLQRLMNEPQAHPYSYEYPEEATMWVIADRLRAYQGFPYPIIYTNLATAIKALTSKSWASHPLNIAHWKVPEPRLPAAWKNVPYTLWQMGVYNPWGQDIDCGRWNEEAYPAPWDPTPPPPPPATAKLHIKVTVKETGEVFEGDLNG